MKSTTAVFTVLISIGLAKASLADYQLHILHINDLHSRIEPINKYDSTCSAEDDVAGECFGGVARVATKINELRDRLVAAGENVIVLDAGDQFQGSLMYTTYKGDVEVEFMNMIGFDAMAVGNHEFDDGPGNLARFVEKADFPIVSGNIGATAGSVLDGKVVPHLVLNVGGERVALLSALAVDTAETSSPGADIQFSDEVTSLSDQVAALEAQGIDKIIALNHVGLTKDKEIAEKVAGLDAVIGGHSHTLFSNTIEGGIPYPLMIEGAKAVKVPVVQAYAYSKFVGHLKLTFDESGIVTAAEGDTILLDSSVVPNATIAARVAELAGPIEELKARFVAKTSVEIVGSRDVCRAGECSMGNLVTDAMLAQTRDQGVQIAIQNGGGLRASIDAGDITMGEVLTVLPFQNTLATLRIAGSGILAALENGVGKVEEGAGRFPQVSGLHYVWDPAAPAGSRIVEAIVVGPDGGTTPLDPDAVYGVVTNNYLRSGGDGYSAFAEQAIDAYDFGPSLEIVVADYLRAKGTYTPFTEERISTK